MMIISRIALVSLVLVWQGAQPLLAQPAETESGSADIERAVDVTQASPLNVAWLSSLRQFIVIVFLGAIAVAGLAYAAGSRGLGLAILGGSLLLYAGYWVVVVLAGPLAPGPTGSHSAAFNAGEVIGSPDRSIAAAVVRTVLNTGLELMSMAVTPFVSIYAALLGLKASHLGGLEPGEFSAFVLGTFIIFGAGSLGALVNVLPLGLWQ